MGALHVDVQVVAALGHWNYVVKACAPLVWVAKVLIYLGAADTAAPAISSEYSELVDGFVLDAVLAGTFATVAWPAPVEPLLFI